MLVDTHQCGDFTNYRLFKGLRTLVRHVIPWEAWRTILSGFKALVVALLRPDFTINYLSSVLTCDTPVMALAAV